jgi:hypothetical protein
MPAMPKRNPARRNKSATKATLSADHDVEAPPLPGDEGSWHPLTLAWWADLWRSPMAPEYDQSDIHGLYMLAALVDQFWSVRDPKLAGEIRLQRQAFGLSPIDRRRLQWEIERTDEAQEKGRKRRAAKPKPTEPVVDPRAVLRAVK